MSRSRLIACAVIWLCAAMLAPNAGAIDWTNPYVDSFDTNIAESDSYAHSLFWPKDVTPLPQPYFYYLGTDKGNGLVFVDYEGQPAELCYAFILPSSQTQRTVTGVIEVDVSFPSNAYISQYWPGELSYQVSSNGMTWSDGAPLSAGYNRVEVACPEGTCYVRFSGTRTVINSLSVSQYSLPATSRVPLNYPTIQAAIDAARHGEVIEVAPGTYSGPGNRDIDFRGKVITVRSAAGPQYTTIDCTGGRRGFYFHSSEGADSALAGFTIQGGSGAPAVPPSLPPLSTGPTLSIGGGIYCESGSPTIANCTITGCTAGIGGGIGIAAQAQPTIIGCTITNCTAVRGAGIGLLAQSNATMVDCNIESNKGTGASLGGGFYCLDSDAILSGCRIANNTGATTGGGVYCTGSYTNVLFQNGLIVGNSANTGPGLDAEQQSSVTVSNCTIAQNRLTTSGTGGGVRSNSASVSISNSIVWGNGATPIFPYFGLVVSYSDIEGSYTGTGNINQDPLFASTTDFHLKSANGRYNSGLWVKDSQTSPCIDAGNPSLSATGEPSPNGDLINMGAYGGSPQASKGASHTVYHVAVDGSDYRTGLSKDRAFRTISTAVTAAQNGDTVLVWPGYYDVSGNEVNFNQKAITIQSAADAAVISAPDGYAFSFYTGEGSGSILSNFVIRGCGAGAIFCYGASPTLKNLTVVGNAACGVNAQEGANPYIVNCIFWANGPNSAADLSQDSTSICTPYYSLVNKKLGGAVVTDPLFADPINGDYHLKSEYGRYVPSLGTWVNDKKGVYSPCIDAGDPWGQWRDHRAEPKPDGDRINLGAYGGTPYASRSNGPSY